MCTTRPVLFATAVLLRAGVAEAQPVLEANAGAFAWQMRFKQDDPYEDELTTDPGPGCSLGLDYREEPANRKIGFDVSMTYTYRECAVSIGSGGHATSDRMYADLRMNTVHLGLGLNIPLDSVGTAWFRPRLMTGLSGWTTGSGYHEYWGQAGQVKQEFEDQRFEEYRPGLRLSLGLGLKVKFGGRLFLDIEPYYSRGLTVECDPANANFRHDEWGLRVGTGVALRGWRNLGQLPMPQD